MYTGKLLFAQMMDHLQRHNFRRCVARYRGEHKVTRFSCLDQYLCMAFPKRESLRDIDALPSRLSMAVKIRKNLAEDGRRADVREWS
jgi:Domain of unknown function (DUF4372)